MSISCSAGVSADGEDSSVARSAVDSLRNIPGLEVFTPDDFNDLPPDQQQVNKKNNESTCKSKAQQNCLF